MIAVRAKSNMSGGTKLHSQLVAVSDEAPVEIRVLIIGATPLHAKTLVELLSIS